MASESRGTWLTPMLLLSITAILVVIVGGYLKSRAAMMGEVSLPLDWEFGTPEMQNNLPQFARHCQKDIDKDLYSS
jgi:hypothetical protein